MRYVQGDGTTSTPFTLRLFSVSLYGHTEVVATATESSLEVGNHTILFWPSRLTQIFTLCWATRYHEPAADTTAGSLPSSVLNTRYYDSSVTPAQWKYTALGHYGVSRGVVGRSDDTVPFLANPTLSVDTI